MSLSSEKVARFKCRFEEVYDLPDNEYMKWLRHAHPESVLNQTASAIQRDTLNHTGGNTQLIYVDEESDLLSEEYVECVNKTFQSPEQTIQ